MEKVKVITTIGPGSNNPEVLGKFRDRGVDFFRINLSHTEVEDIEKRVEEIKDYGVSVILDTEGNQIRSGNESIIRYEEGALVRLYNKKVECNKESLFLRPENVVNLLREGDLIVIDFNSLLLRVVEIKNLNEGYVECVALIGGEIGGKKAVHVDSPTFKLPPFSEKDLVAIEIGKKYGIRNFTLSFMESKYDVEEFRKFYPEAKVYSKIESEKGLKNYLEIARVSDGILIDRGDLSTQIPIEKIPFIQKNLIRRVRDMGKEVFVATNTLEQMSVSLKPNRAEVNDIINTVLDGVSGIALTKETAVGMYPVETVNMIMTLLKQVDYISKSDADSIVDKIEDSGYIKMETPGLLVKPHGGKLVNRFDPDYFIVNKTPEKKIVINEEELMDLEQIGIGSFSPLEGFMTFKDFNSVINNYRLSDGVVWPLPIYLTTDEDVAGKVNVGEDVCLIYEGDGEVYGILHLEDKGKINKEESCEKIYGTNNLEHPGVKNFLDGGNILLGGKITLTKRRNSPYKIYELTPGQTRKIFMERGWSKVLGFHTRNVIHRSHEFIQMEGMKRALCDGLFVHPVIGKKKPGDFEADVIIRGYEEMIENVYPKSKAALCSFASYSRYGGPREALFTALVRKNFGCSHFIVGRDHTGVKDFYHPKASHDIFDKFTEEELGIIPVKFDKVFFSSVEEKYIHDTPLVDYPENTKLNISGTEAREMLMKGEQPPSWFMRPEISKMIIDKFNKGEKVFV